MVGKITKREIVNVYWSQNIYIYIHQNNLTNLEDCEQGTPCVNLSKTSRSRVLNDERAKRLVSERNKQNIEKKIESKISCSRAEYCRKISQNTEKDLLPR